MKKRKAKRRKKRLWNIRLRIKKMNSFSKWIGVSILLRRLKKRKTLITILLKGNWRIIMIIMRLKMKKKKKMMMRTVKWKALIWKNKRKALLIYQIRTKLIKKSSMLNFNKSYLMNNSIFQ